jgi:hypothetical protein
MNITRTKARSYEKRNKRRNLKRIKVLVALLWGVHSGGERESAGKNREKTKRA